MTVQRRFQIMYLTEPPADKAIREWYMKFQQSGCLCAAKRSGRPGPSAETVDLITGLTSSASPRVHISSSCKVGQKLGETLYPLICFFLPCLSWLLRSQFSKSRRDLWITLYIICTNRVSMLRSHHPSLYGLWNVLKCVTLCLSSCGVDCDIEVVNYCQTQWHFLMAQWPLVGQGCLNLRFRGHIW